MERGTSDESRGQVLYKYRLAALSFIHKTESCSQDWDTRSWNLGDLIVAVLLLGAARSSAYYLFSPERKFGEEFF